MKFIDKILRKRGYLKEHSLPKEGYVKREVKKASLQKYGERVYQAALKDRFTYNWINISSSIDADIRSGVKPVRDRARDVTCNDDYGKSFILRSRANIPGAEGFNLQMRVEKPDGTPDTEVNELIEKKWKDWTKKQYCTMQGQLSFLRVQWLETFHLRRDGEILARMIYGKGVNKHGFSLDLLEPDDLDETFNAVLNNGNIVKMGVELDKWRKPVAFWLKKTDLLGFLNNSTNYDRERILAEDIIFAFDPEHSKQTRGMSHMAQSLMRLRAVGEWEKDSLTNAEASAKKLGFIIRKAIDGQEMEEDDSDEDGNPIMEFKSGTIEELPYGREFQSFEPKYPHEQHTPFLKSQLRGAAAGLGLSYNSFANDLEGVNFSSMRSGLLDERDNWAVLQSLFRESFLITVFENWLKWSIMVGELKLDYLEYDRYNQPEFQGRIWPWVSPKEDVEAAILEVKHGLNSRTRINRRRGIDTLDIYTELEKETQTAKEKNINITGENKNESSSGSTQNTNNTETDDTPAGSGQGND